MPPQFSAVVLTEGDRSSLSSPQRGLHLPQEPQEHPPKRSCHQHPDRRVLVLVAALREAHGPRRRPLGGRKPTIVGSCGPSVLSTRPVRSPGSDRPSARDPRLLESPRGWTHRGSQVLRTSIPQGDPGHRRETCRPRQRLLNAAVSSGPTTSSTGAHERPRIDHPGSKRRARGVSISQGRRHRGRDRPPAPVGVGARAVRGRGHHAGVPVPPHP